MFKSSRIRWLIVVLVIIGSCIVVKSWVDGFLENWRSPTSARETSTVQAFNKKQLSIDDPASMWVVVNKKRQLKPKEYAPADLVTPNVALRSAPTTDEMQMRKEAAGALEQMFAAAKVDGINLLMASGYRPYSLQASVYNRYVKNDGQASADSQSARPGHSEHQTGLAVDVGGTNRVCEIQDCFADTPEAKWVAVNAYKYGYIVRYQKDTRSTVGYIYEPWHIRYVGKLLAAELRQQKNPPLETFFGLEAAADY